jgi:hypothetical protein
MNRKWFDRLTIPSEVEGLQKKPRLPDGQGFRQIMVNKGRA